MAAWKNMKEVNRTENKTFRFNFIQLSMPKKKKKFNLLFNLFSLRGILYINICSQMVIISRYHVIKWLITLNNIIIRVFMKGEA